MTTPDPGAATPAGAKLVYPGVRCREQGAVGEFRSGTAAVCDTAKDPNRKALPEEAHEAAVLVGGEAKHFIWAR